MSKKNVGEEGFLDAVEQRNIKWDFFKNPDGGIYYIEPDFQLTKEMELDDVMFFIENTGIGFHVSNWREFFESKKKLKKAKKIQAHIELLWINPSAIYEEGLYIGDVVIWELVD